MLSLKQTQWFSFRIFNLNCCLFKSQLYNLKTVFVNGKLSLYNYFLVSVMRTKSSKIKKQSLKIIRLQDNIMAAMSNTKNNTKILKAESTKKVQTGQDSSSSSAAGGACMPSTCKKEEENSRCRFKESIRSSSNVKVDKKLHKDNSNKHKTYQQNTLTHSSHANVSSNVLIPSLRGNVSWRYNNGVWSSTPDESCLLQSMPVTQPLAYRSFSDSRLQQHLNLVYSHENGYYNRYRMRRSNTADTTNITAAAELDKQQAWALRTWQRTAYGKKIAKRDRNEQNCQFTLMSYNVLAQELLTEHSYLYRGHQPKALLWEQRWTNLLTEIKQHKADILCLQEVQESHLENYYSELKKLGYDVIYKRRTGERTDGCAMYYNSSLFKLVEYTTVEFNQSNIPVLNRDNVAIVAKFSPTNNPKSEFVVATTHLLYNPRREDVRLAQTQVLLSEIDRISFKKNGSKHFHLPIVMTGDFNLTPESSVYELLIRGNLKYDHLSNRTLSKFYSFNETGTPANETGKLLLPPSLRITDNCQHADLVEKRKENNMKREDELQLIQLQHSERMMNAKCPKKVNKSMFSTGTLSHHLALKSAYEHRQGDTVEATTYQDEWITVDYIFYSGVHDEDNNIIRDGKLKLLSRYAIPTRNRLQGVKIPNFAFGSDHFSLVVKFQLDS